MFNRMKYGFLTGRKMNVMGSNLVFPPEELNEMDQ